MKDGKQNMELNLEFLKLLGVEKKEATLEALSELVFAHFSIIPFENISKLYYKQLFGLQHLPAFSQYLNGIAENCFGGTCYSNNYFFYRLLKFLGYEVKLCGADMKDPDSHLVIIVTINHIDYLVDVGNAAPFLHPIPLNLETGYTISSGREKYIFKPRGNNCCSRLEMLRNGIPKSGYLIKPTARKIEDFHDVISGSFKEGSTFLNAILITKYISGKFYTIHNLELIVSTSDNFFIQRISDLDELSSLIDTIFKIPLSISREVIKNMNILKDAWN